MARNVEVKARIEAEQFDSLRQRAREIATDGPIELVQTDTFFFSKTGRLKLREFPDGTGELIFYERPDRTGPKSSEYVLADCTEPANVKAALESSNGILGVVKKHREVFLVDKTRIHLDQVNDLGTFLELEVVLGETDTAEQGEEVSREILGQLNVSASQLVSGAYFDLLEQQT